MANDLLTSFKAASRQYNHVVFNDRTQQFERAGKRHAIATFFGTADAKARNQATLAKIKEALAAEVQEGGRFQGLGKDMDKLFAAVKGDKRINSETIRSIIKTFRQEAKSVPEELRRLKDEVLKDVMAKSDCISPGAIDNHVRGMLDLLNGYGGGSKVLEMVARHLLDRNLSGETVESAIKSLQDSSRKMQVMGKVMSDMVSFLVGVGNDSVAKSKLLDVFRLVNERGKDRFDRMVGCELARIVASYADSPLSFNVRAGIESLLSQLRDDASVQNFVVGMQSLPIEPESYAIVCDFCKWSEDSMHDCMRLLNRQSPDSRVPLLAAMKAFGESSDVFLLQRLVGVQDKIKVLHSYGRLDAESVFRAIEGDMAEVPVWIADTEGYRNANQRIADHYAYKVSDKIDELLAPRDMTEEARMLAKIDAFLAARSTGVSAEAAVKIACEIGGARYAVFTGERCAALRELKAVFGDRFERMPSSVKYNLMAVPAEYRRPISEALLLIMGGQADDERILHFLVANKDGISGLWNANRLTAENVLRVVAEGVVNVPQGTTDWSFGSVIGNPLMSCVKDSQIPPEMIESTADTQFNTQIEALVFEYGLGAEEARAFLKPEELAGFDLSDIGVPDRLTHINPHYQVIGVGFGEGVNEAFKQLNKDLVREPTYQIVIELPEMNISEVIEPETANDEDGRRVEAGKHCEDLVRILTGLCGEDNREQIAMALFAMSQSTKMALMPYALRNGVATVSGAFALKYEISSGADGDVKLRMTNLPESRLTLDWTITIHPDGVHEATQPVVAPNRE